MRAEPQSHGYTARSHHAHDSYRNARRPMKVAFHVGQLLQPVPGGIGRYVRAMLRELPRLGIDPIAFAAGPRPRGIHDTIAYADLGWPRGSLRYELWNRSR